MIGAIVNWFMGPSGFDWPWSFGERGPRYEAEARGDPSVRPAPARRPGADGRSWPCSDGAAGPVGQPT